ncbi:hypothetical protein BC834DRAFT_52865 [Gloeopeniophorella convolvens]|nr:hypothetical protein BC834DRAFT_52865 [Gloeopeniophorella convolvens]
MSRSGDNLIQNNAQIFRVYERRLSNPADVDIFTGAASKLTKFLSNKRAYYAEAQPHIIELLEVAHNSLKSVAPDVFRTPGTMNRASLPQNKLSLFDGFEGLAKSVLPYVHMFTAGDMRN